MPTLSLLSFNCFGVPTTRTTARLRLLAEILNQESYDIVALQEVQTQRYCRQLITECTTYPYHAFTPFVHAPKGGLLLLSRLPVQSKDYVLFRERGLWYTPALTDWILHKGVLVMCTQVGDVSLTVMNTHLTANYLGDWETKGVFSQHEHQQLLQIADLVQAEPPENLVVACGDFNVPRGSWLMQSFLSASGLTDPAREDFNATYRPRRGMSARYAQPIDFTLYRAPTEVRSETRIRFKDRILWKGRQWELSDHYAVELKLSW
jgi:endonuclease/exonuclease/phosphatase family metal-dependent hydrolase